MAIQPVTFRPITAVPAVARKPDEATRNAGDPKRPRKGRRLDPGQGENLDTWA